MGELRQDLRAGAFAQVGGDQYEMQFALAAAELVASNDQDSGAQHEGKQPLDRVVGTWFAHPLNLRPPGPA